MQKPLLFISSLLLSFAAFAQQSPFILPLRQQAEVQDAWLENRMQTVLPEIMRRTGIDMWIVAAREYNEDPVIETMLPATWLAARRRTVLIMYDRGEDEGIEYLAVARYDVGTTFKKAWEPEQEPNQWQRVADIIAEKQPNKIGINKSEHFALADGLTAAEYDSFLKVLPKAQQQKLSSAAMLAIGWLETRSPEEMVVYEQICRIAHNIIAEGFSENVIQLGVTTTDDIVWWYRERIKSLKLDTWFHPTVDIQRADPESFDHLRTFSKRPELQTIMPGDLLHVDFGITYLGLNTDTQQHAYVLKPEETAVPDYLVAAFEKGNRLQDILTDAFETGRTGNEILKAAREQAEKEGIEGTIYTHPIGYHGHAAGPAIGMWDNQGEVPHTGDYPLYPNTAFSIELNAAVQIDEWDKKIRIMLEEEAFFDGQKVRYMDGRQKKILPIPRKHDHLGN